MLLFRETSMRKHILSYLIPIKTTRIQHTSLLIFVKNHKSRQTIAYVRSI